MSGSPVRRFQGKSGSFLPEPSWNGPVWWNWCGQCELRKSNSFGVWVSQASLEIPASGSLQSKSRPPVLHSGVQSICSALTISKSCEHLLCFGQTLPVLSHTANQRQRAECSRRNRSAERWTHQHTACPDALELIRVLPRPRRSLTHPRWFRGALEEDRQRLL